jgi:hypothetical protein
VKKILVVCLFLVCGLVFADQELGYVYFKYEVIDTPWTGYVPQNASNLSNMVCLDITFKSNLPKEYTDYFIDALENQESNEGFRGGAFGYSGKVFAIFTRTSDGFISRRPFTKRWDHPNGAFDTPNMGNYEGYTESFMQRTIASYVQFILNTARENVSAKAAGNTSVPNIFEDVEQGFRFRKTNLFERKWIVYKH